MMDKPEEARQYFGFFGIAEVFANLLVNLDEIYKNAFLELEELWRKKL